MTKTVYLKHGVCLQASTDVIIQKVRFLKLFTYQNIAPTFNTTLSIDIVTKEDLLNLSNLFKELAENYD